MHMVYWTVEIGNLPKYFLVYSNSISYHVSITVLTRFGFAECKLQAPYFTVDKVSLRCSWIASNATTLL